MKNFFLFFSVLFFSAISFAQAPSLPLDFESPTANYTFTDFDGGATVKIANTQSAGINTSANVARMIKNAGQTWGGSWIQLANPIDFSVNKTFKVKVYSPRVGAKLLLKVENATNAAISFEKEATTTLANAWEDLTFDYSTISTSNQYQKLVFIFDNGTMGDGSANFTFLFDDVRLIANGGATLTQMNLPVTFDDATVDYGVVGFGGADQSSIVTDPTLASNKVAKVIKTNVAELWAGTTVTAVNAASFQTGFSSNIPFAAGATKMNVRVWSPHAGIPVRLKVEDKNDATRSCETEATVTVASGWQTLEFNFANQAAGTAALNLAFSYNKVSIFFNFGTTGAVAGERIYYFDDVKFGAAGAATLTQMNLPVTFDDATVDYGVVGFGGADQSSIVTDPTLASNKVAKVIKTNVAELWAGTTVTAVNAASFQTGFSSNIPFAAGATKMNVRVWSPHAGIPVRLKVEDKNDATRSCETEATVTVASGWQTLEFNFANQAAGTSALNLAFSYNKVSIFFNFGTTGAVAGERIYYFDDVKFGAAAAGGGLTQMNLPVTFDDATVDYGVVGFGGADQSSIVTDPTLASNKVAKVIKTNVAELWAGTTLTAVNAASFQTGFSGNIPFAAGATKMNVRVWSPHAGIPVRLKVEDKNDPTRSCETEATVTVASGWQTLEFDFATQAAGTAALNLAFSYNKVSIFFNFGTTGAVAGERIYYFDDVKFGAIPASLTQMNLPVTFDDATVDYGLVGFGGAEQSTIVTDPTLASNKVAKVIKTNVAELWAGTTVTAMNAASFQTGFSSNIPFAVGATKMNVRVWSPHAGIQVRLKVEDKNDPTRSCETEATVTVASGWQTLEFNFANQAAGTAALNLAFSFNKVSIFFNFGTTGAVAGERIYYFDDVKFGAAAAGGGLTQMNLPVTFDDATVDYGVVGFGGADQSSIVTDPTLASNKVAKVIKTNVAELWAGTTVTAVNAASFQTGFSGNIPFAAGATKMNIRVWSPHAGIPVRLKVEDKNDPTRSCETEATVTVASGWQTLEFNFANQAAGTAALNFAFSYNKVSIFFNFGTTGAVAGERIYYFDDIKFGAIPGPLTQMNLPVTFDDATVDYGLVGFGGAEQSSIVTDPTLASNKVAKVIKTNTAELWAGTTVTAVNAASFQTGFSGNIPFAAGATKMNVRVWSPHAGIPVRLKVEDKNDPTRTCETEATITTASGWETLEFDFATQAAGTAALNFAFSYNKVSIFFNFGTTGAVAGERIYYFDDVKFGAAPLEQMNLPVTFDAPRVEYGLVGFGGAEQSTIVTDPTLASNKVAKVIKTNTAELWAGTTVTAVNAATFQTGFSSNIPFAAGATKMNVRVWSPHAGIPVRLKVEDKNDPTHSCETEAYVTVASGWQVLEFNFANQATGTAALNLAFSFNKVSIFFNFGTTGATAGERIYYFDDVRFGGNNSAAAPTVTSPVNYCQNATAVPLTATPTAGNTLLWYTVATGGIASFTAPTPSTTVAGTFNYYVSQINAVGAESPRSLIAVSVSALPVAPIATTLVTYCQNAIAGPLTATALAGNTLKWYTVAVGGTSSATAPTPSTTVAGTTPYYVSQMNAVGCEGPRTTINVVVNPAPGLPTVVTPINYCQNTTAVPLTATASAGNTLKWYTVPVAGFGSATAPTPSTATPGTVTYYVSQVTALGCESGRAAIAVVVNATPGLPTTSTVTYCQNSTAIPLTATAAAGNTLKWYTVATGGTGTAIAPTPSTASAVTTTYYVSQVTPAGCEGNRATLNVVVNPTPVAPVATTPVLFCQNDPYRILTATAAVGNSLNWYTTAVGGASSTIAPTPITSVTGTSTFYVSQTNGFACESPRAAIVVTVNPLPAAPTIAAAPYTKLYPGMTTTISAASSIGNTYSWYRNGLLIPGQTSNAVNVTVDGIGTYQMKVTNTNGCVNSSNTVIISDESSAKLFIYPNPSTGKFQVRYFSDITDLKPRWLAVYDSKGSQVLKGKFIMFGAYTSVMLDLSNKGAGIYTIYLMDNDGKKLKSAQVVIR